MLMISIVPFTVNTYYNVLLLNSMICLDFAALVEPRRGGRLTKLVRFYIFRLLVPTIGGSVKCVDCVLYLK